MIATSLVVDMIMFLACCVVLCCVVLCLDEYMKGASANEQNKFKEESKQKRQKKIFHHRK